MRQPSYQAQTLEHPNPVARFAHRARFRVGLRLAAALAPRDGLALDFGAADGAFLHRLGQRRPDLRRLAVEPFRPLAHPCIRLRRSLAEVEGDTVDLLTAFEVLEHLTPAELGDWILQARRVCRPGAVLLVSVPVMQGLALPLKLASRRLLYRRPGDYRWGEMLRGLAARPVPRAANVRASHKGFDHRALRALLARHFTIVATRRSPFAWLPWWASSQLFWRLAQPAGQK
jgi:hypothetical protein